MQNSAGKQSALSTKNKKHHSSQLSKQQFAKPADVPLFHSQNGYHSESISKSHTTQNPLFGMRNLSNQNQNRISNPSDYENNLFAQPAQRKDLKRPSAQNTKQTTLSQTFNKKDQNQAQGIDSTSSIINDFKNCQLQSSAPASDEMQHLQSHQNLQYLNQSATKNEVPQRKSQQTLNSTRISGATGLNSTAQNLNQSTLSGFTNPFSVQNSASKPQQQDQLDLLMFEQSHQRPFQRHSQSSQQDDIRTSTDRIPSSISQQNASNVSNAQLLGQIFTNPQQVAQIETTLKETMSASDWNYVQILKKALRETVEENDKLLNKVAVLEQKVQTQDEKIQAQDRSIVELTLCLNNLMNGELVDGLFGNQEGDQEGDEVENQDQRQVSQQQQNLQQQQQLLDQSSESDTEEIRFQSR
eukprot:403355269